MKVEIEEAIALLRDTECGYEVACEAAAVITEYIVALEKELLGVKGHTFVNTTPATVQSIAKELAVTTVWSYEDIKDSLEAAVEQGISLHDAAKCVRSGIPLGAVLAVLRNLQITPSKKKR